MNFKILKSLLFTVLCGIWAFGATAVTPMFSDYGQIQNVQYYSTNPFWTPNSPYNKRMPQPVYVQGADLNTEDCMNVVQSLVYVQCLARDNCRDTSLSDIRPTIMVQLSNLPGNNYVSACAGYIDGVFDAFVKQYGNSIPNRAVAFPDATVPNPNIQNMNTSPQQYNQNSYQPTNNKKIPDWQSAINERTQELIELQNQNGADSYNLSATDFPATVEDLSFASQVALKTDGYEPFMGKHAYTLPTIKGQDEFCKKYPDDPRCPEKETKEVKEGPREEPRQEHEQEHRQEEENLSNNFRFAILFAPSNAGFQKNDVITPDATELSDWYYEDNCSSRTIWWSISDNTDINKFGQRVFSEYAHSDFYIDFPKKEDPLIFPGLLHVAKGAGGSWTSPRTYAARVHNYIVMFTDLNSAMKKAQSLKTTLDRGNCSGLSMYLVALDVDANSEIVQSSTGASFEDNANYDFWSNIKSSRIKKVKIVSEPIKIE